MSLSSFFFMLYARWIVAREYKTHEQAEFYQENFIRNLIHTNTHTTFGSEHQFAKIKSYQDFTQNIPLRFYEDYRLYIEAIQHGEVNVLTKTKPLYLLMTSGTTSGIKFIPITKKGLKHQIDAALKQLCFYALAKNTARFVDYKMIFIQGSPVLSNDYAIPCGRLSGVVYHHIPRFFQRNKLPQYTTNCIENWSEKIRAIVRETYSENLSVIGGIPPWCNQYFELVLAQSGSPNLKTHFPQLMCYIYGGLDFTNYKSYTQSLLGSGVDCLQTFPASEGFFALQDKLDTEDMLLLLHQGIYYEFIPQSNANSVINLSKVISGEIYELVITNESGLWRYRMGDLIQFTHLKPYRIRVMGRTSQFISAFGEHIIGSEIEKAIQFISQKFNLIIEDYHVSPNITDRRYEWQIEWREAPIQPLDTIEQSLDIQLSQLNIYYNHLYKGKIINGSRIISLPSHTFKTYRQNTGKEGGQNKIVRLANHQQIAKQLEEIAGMWIN